MRTIRPMGSHNSVVYAVDDDTRVCEASGGMSKGANRALAQCPPPRPLGARGVISGYVDQGREMTVPVTELERLDEP